MFGVKLQTTNFPTQLVSNNIVFYYTGQNFENKDHAIREANYMKRERFYVRVIKRGTRYGVYAKVKN